MANKQGVNQPRDTLNPQTDPGNEQKTRHEYNTIKQHSAIEYRLSARQTDLVLIKAQFMTGNALIEEHIQKALDRKCHTLSRRVLNLGENYVMTRGPTMIIPAGINEPYRMSLDTGRHSGRRS